MNRRKLSIVLAWLAAFSVCPLQADNDRDQVDPKQYSQIIRNLGDFEGFFPREVPSYAIDVHVSCMPVMLLQAGSHLQLQMTLPATQVNKYYARYASKAKYRFKGGDTNDHANVKGGVPTTFYYGQGDGKFPKSFDIFVMKANSSSHPPNDLEWNHGESQGVAISSQPLAWFCGQNGGSCVHAGHVDAAQLWMRCMQGPANSGTLLNRALRARAPKQRTIMALISCTTEVIEVLAADGDSNYLQVCK